jgi:hypothetical protein
METKDALHFPAWVLIATLTALLTAVSTYEALRRYDELRSAWSWDLAYYNQWYWALTQGDRTVSVRPLSFYGEEGPSVWKMNYLAPIRFALVPFYRFWSDPRILLVLQNVIFWWVIPAAYTLVRSESRSDALAVSAALLVPSTPLLWPLVANDFRELQLGAPFILWAVQGIRGRSSGLATIGIAGMLACRQEYAVMLATFAFLPAREPENLSVTLRWRQLTLLLGLLWFVPGFFGYLRLVVGRNAPSLFIDQLVKPKAPLNETMQTSLETLFLGVGVWAILACLMPRIAVLAVPWIVGPCSGEWAMRVLGSSSWHHVRYVMPMVGITLAAGLVGYARLGNRLPRYPRGWAWMTLVLASAALTSAIGLWYVAGQLARVPVPIDRREADEIWSRIREVGPDDGVLADYQVAAPLSSRRRLYGYGLDWNVPLGFPRLGPEIRWLFVRTSYPFLKVLLDQGFEVVHRGSYLTIARRVGAPRSQNSDILRFCANTMSR